MRTSRVLATAATAAVLALAGCGGGAATTADPAAPPSTAATPTAFATVDELYNAIAAATSAKPSAKINFSTDAGGQSISADGVMNLDPNNVAIQLSLTLPGQAAPLEVRFVDEAFYVQSPQDPNQWIKPTIDPNDPSTAQLAGLTDQVDINKQFAVLRPGSTLNGSAPETVDGVAATRYDLTVDVAKAAAAAQDPTAKAQFEQIQAQNVDSFDLQIWTDAQNLPVQQRQSFTLQGQQVVTVVKTSDWGAPVTVEAPPAAQVIEQ